jgi:3-hydroxyacyl-CoA dehydrogenase
MPQPIKTVAVIGCGVIGMSWASLFLARGLKVIVSDPVEGAEENFKRYISEAWSVLQASGSLEQALAAKYEFVDDIKLRLAEVDFIQEVTIPIAGCTQLINVPDTDLADHDTYRRMDPSAYISRSSL